MCLGATAFDNHRKIKNTVFLDEQLEGEIFENLRGDQRNDEVVTNVVVNPYRLPTTTKPTHYKVHWIVDTLATELTFGGHVEITLHATQANVSEIVIHSDGLNIADVLLTRNGEIVPRTYYLQPEYDFLRVQLVGDYLEYNEASSADYVLTVTFNAELRHDMYGIYRSWYRDYSPYEQPDPSYMATTQFQATSARRAFPCYDEPSFKAEFDVIITRRQNVRSWFCTKFNYTDDSINGPGFLDDYYTTTPIMSTYLLALIVADYVSERTPNTPTEEVHEVIGRRAAMADGQYVLALQLGWDLLEEMNDHTDLNFFSVSDNLKMTQAAIPDFGAGAMENWGLLTYREAYLMHHENHTNANSEQLIAYILSHEIAHMWFGNLVTCDWWDVLWLNEGFARYYQYFLTDSVKSEYGLGIRFINEQVHTSLLSDSVVNAHPLTNPGVGSPGQVSSMFSTITYNKGAAVIRMTKHLLGELVHREGLRNYLQERELKTALPIHLFQALQDAADNNNATFDYGADFSVIDYYRSWTEKGGHPVLNVQVNHATGIMTVSQRRFDINTGYAASPNWIIPITFTTESNPDFNNTKPTYIVSEGVVHIDRGSVGDEWVIFNIQQTGFYRVNYDSYTWNLIALALNGTESPIHEYNRAQIVNDLFQFARSGLMSYNRAFSLLSFLKYEMSYNPWVAAITGFNWLRNRFAATEHEETLNSFIRDLAENVMADLTYLPDLGDEENEGESFMRSYQRMQLAPFMCLSGSQECRDAAVDQFNTLKNGVYEVPVDNRPWVYCNALRAGDASDYDFLFDRFLNHTVYTEKIVILGALGCTNDEESLKAFLDYIMEDTYVIRRQDYSTAFNSAVTGNENNTQIVFEYIKGNLDKVIAAYNVTSSIASPLSTISSRLRTQEEVDEFLLWANTNRNALGASFNSIVSGAQSQLTSFAWTAEAQQDIVDFITNGESDEPLDTSTAAPVTSPEVEPTVTPSPLVSPATPDIPERASAVTAAVSAAVVAIVAAVNVAL